MTTTTVLRSEWTKLTTLRSQWFTPLLAVLISVGITLAVNLAYAQDTSLTEDPSVGLFYGFNFGQVALACFGILLMGQEYNSGTVRGSLTAVPRRGLLYGGKLLVGSGVGLLAGLLITGGSLLAVDRALGVDLTAPGTVRSLTAGVLYCPLLVLICLGVTSMLRNLTAAMGLLTPTVFLGTIMLSAIPGVRDVAQFLPDRAGQYAFRQQPDPNIWYGHWTGLLIMAAWAALAVWGGWRSLSRKDV
ncbi:ABC-type transport system involved in multi-copper enzyme maturation permease subunit [Kitasatospora gansuensis]|uniref:ABC-type transport system involved in multi-copper enzyme maturation permease subunit n=1 Tax=Kitasatospora gansuensis TaxID=258050 RepID=A0A7W7WG26_9ACTN|nr:ABC transporter permease subunit [Kitasatospora gansuensis]MBB4945796.1 ABC-type transport system involved in multi-copper enzyme maturation permease subunit [Kitasatospora gansuensis]